MVDTHHATLSRAMTRYIRIGNSILRGEDIENANRNLAGTYVRHINPDCSKQTSVKTIKGISNWHYIEWPIAGSYAGGFLAFKMPHIGQPDCFDGKRIFKILGKDKT